MIVHNWASTIILILMIDTQMCMGINNNNINNYLHSNEMQMSIVYGH